MILLSYRLRPMPGAVMGGFPILLLIGTWLLAPHLGADGAMRFLQVAAVLLGVVAAFTVSSDVDAPEAVLSGAPHPFWRTPAVRVLVWIATACVVVFLLGREIYARVDVPLSMSDELLLAQADLLFVAGVAFVVAICAGSFVGGSSALAVTFACVIVERLWSDWPLRLLDPAGAPHWEQTRAMLLLTGLACLALGLLYLRVRGLPARHLAVWSRSRRMSPRALTEKARIE